MGKVYILTNDLMPGIVKIGYTTQSIKERLKELDRTGVPWPFRCHFAIETERYKEIESLMHDAFADYRVRNNREFFKISPEKVVAALRISGAEEIKISNVAIDKDGIERETPVENNLYKKRFPFSKYGIPVGAELFFTRNKEKKCKVIDGNDVEFEGKRYSLSKLAMKFMNELGYNWKYVRGPSFFEYNGEVLSDIQDKSENEQG